MQDIKEILEILHRKRDELTAQLQAVNNAIKEMSITYSFEVLQNNNKPTESYSEDFTMDKKIHFILNELGEATVPQIVKVINQKEPKNAYVDLNKAVSMAVSRLYNIGNKRYITTNGGRIRSKPDPTDSRRNIYYL